KAGESVLFVDDERPSEERSHNAAGKREVAAHAEDHVRAMHEDRTRALPESDEQPERQEKKREPPPAPHARKTYPGHVVPVLGDQGRFHTRFCPEPHHAPAGLAQVVGHGETGEDMSPRSTRHDHDGSRHDGFTPLSLASVGDFPNRFGAASRAPSNSRAGRSRRSSSAEG